MILCENGQFRCFARLISHQNDTWHLSFGRGPKKIQKTIVYDQKVILKNLLPMYYSYVKYVPAIKCQNIPGIPDDT